MKINNKDYKIVLWGWETTENTFHYIHKAYYKAFKHLGVETYWINDKSDLSGLDFSNTLFFTEGQVDKNIPLREDCLYLLHNCYDPKYQPLKDKGLCFTMQTYTDDVLTYNVPKAEDGVYVDYSGRGIYFFWPTDLLPDEIEKNKPNRVFNKESKIINWIGTVGRGTFGNWEEIANFKRACFENGISWFDGMNISDEDTIRMIKDSYMAPTITGEWRTKVGYLPCRISKTISYGQALVTSSPRANIMFDGFAIFDANPYKLFYTAKEALEKMPLSKLHAQMDYVKEKHTYLNRINSIIRFIEKCNE